MILLSDLGYLFRSELPSKFLGLFRLSELDLVILKPLFVESMDDLCSKCVSSVYSLSFMLILQFSLESCFVCTGSAYFMLLMFRSSTVWWKIFVEPVRFSTCA